MTSTSCEMRDLEEMCMWRVYQCPCQLITSSWVNLFTFDTVHGFFLSILTFNPGGIEFSGIGGKKKKNPKNLQLTPSASFFCRVVNVSKSSFDADGMGEKNGLRYETRFPSGSLMHIRHGAQTTVYMEII